MKKTSARDLGIEFARLLGCFIVIGVHVSLNDMINGVYDSSRGLINCFLADGVAVFWLITGCFLFRTTSYKKILLRTTISIALPVGIYSIVCLFFSNFIISGGSLIQPTYVSFKQYLVGFRDALMLQPSLPLTSHLWFCYTYILVMIAFPVLKAFVQWLEEDYKREIWFCIISFTLICINDFVFNQTFEFSHHGINSAVPASVEMIWGAILYKRKKYLTKYKLLWISAIVCFVVLNIIRMFFVKYTMTKSILAWHSSIGLLCAISVIVFASFVGMKLNNKKALSYLDLWLAKHTFFIYLVHIPVIAILERLQVATGIFNYFSSFTNGFVLDIIYTVCLMLIVFFLSLIVSVGITIIVYIFSFVSKKFLRQ